MHHPLMVFDGETDLLIDAVLRPGDAHGGPVADCTSHPIPLARGADRTAGGQRLRRRPAAARASRTGGPVGGAGRRGGSRALTAPPSATRTRRLRRQGYSAI